MKITRKTHVAMLVLEKNYTYYLPFSQICRELSLFFPINDEKTKPSAENFCLKYSLSRVLHKNNKKKQMSQCSFLRKITLIISLSRKNVENYRSFSLLSTIKKNIARRFFFIFCPKYSLSCVLHENTKKNRCRHARF